MTGILLPNVTTQKWMPHLDMLRGLAAFAVLVGHIRGLVFFSGSKQPDLSLIGQCFFFLTSLGHQAVIVFFALSGFLVGGSAFRQIIEGRWQIYGYWTRRLSRLGTVLIPALLVTLACDLLGSYHFGDVFYSGALYDQLASGPTKQQPTDLSLLTFLGNILFMQTIVVPVYGSNGPLWSLANEFWYYLVFPLTLMVMFRKFNRWVNPIITVFLLLVFFAFLPFSITALGLIWVTGALAMLFSGWIHPYLRKYPLLSAFGILLFVIPSLLLSKFVPSLWSDIVLGLAVSLALPFLMIFPSPSRIYEKVAHSLSEISYSLYACHFPIAVLLWLAVSNAQQVKFDTLGTGRFAVLLFITFSLSWLFWWLTERHTTAVRKWMDNVVSSKVDG